MSRVATDTIDYTNKDYEAFREMMIDNLKEKMPEYTDTSQSDAGIVILECLANGLDILSMYSDIIANDVLLPTTQDRRIACILAKSLGYTPYNHTASITPQVFVLNAVKEEDVIIPKGTVVTTQIEEGQEEIKFETVESLLIPAGNLGNEQNEDGTYKFTVDVVQGTSVTDDLLGSSTGAPYQTFKLKFQKVLVDSITLFVDEGNGAEEWTRVESFLDRAITSTSKVYTATLDDFDNCYIEFGNGSYGKIPDVFSNGISADYRIGDGEIGNVQANTITELETSIAFVEETFNPLGSTTLAHDKESIDEIRNNAPASFKTRDRAVTLTDYEDLISVNNKGNLYAFLHTKASRNEEDKTVVSLYYQLRDGYEMTEALNQEVQDFFSTRAMVGTSVELSPYVEFIVNLEANLVIDKDYSRAEITESVKSYILGAFFNYGAFSFEDEFIKSDLEGEIMSTFDGVKSFRITSPTEDIITTTNPYEIITVKEENITLNVTGGK